MATGVKASLPAVTSVTVMLWLAVTAMPLSLRLPAIGRAVMVIDWRVLPVSTSLNPKSLVLRTLVLSSLVVRVRLLAVGASLVLTTVRSKISLTTPPLLSVPVTLRLSRPTLAFCGVPLNVWVAGLKLSQVGSALPLARVAV